MSSFIADVKQRAKSSKKHIVLPEGNDIRTLEAAQKVLAEQTAELTILGDVDFMNNSGFDLNGATLIDPCKSELLPELSNLLFELRQAKGLDESSANELAQNPLYFGVLMVKAGKADGMVAGACNATGDVLRPALQVIKTAPGAKLVSSFFVMVVPNCEYGEHGRFVFADCGLNVQTDAESLANIAIDSAHSFESIIGTTPKVALLSHSTYKSANNEDAEKVVKATKIARELAPELLLDGELQLDAAICPSVADSKCPDSKVAGHANVLIFPDLDSGNIGYKLVQRLAKAEAYGPITQGLAAPVNDLSRGCSAEDIAGVIAITCLQCQ